MKWVLGIIVLFLVMSCSEPQIQTLAVHDQNQEKQGVDDFEVPQPETEQAPKIPTEEQPAQKSLRSAKTFEDVTVGERLFYGDNELWIIDVQGNEMQIRINDIEENVLQGESLVTNGLEIQLDEIKIYERESYGLAKFIFVYDDRWKQLSFQEQDQKSYTRHNTKYTVTLAYVGTSKGEDAAIFQVNDEKTDIMRERDTYYFRDGSYIYLQEIMQGKSPRLVHTTYLTITVNEIQ